MACWGCNNGLGDSPTAGQALSGVYRFIVEGLLIHPSQTMYGVIPVDKGAAPQVGGQKFCPKSPADETPRPFGR